MKRLFFGVLLCFSQIGHAQLYQQNIIPPLPEASELGKFVDFPASLYTGRPEIQIPLYTVKLKEFSLPISLSYNSKGNQVDDIASNVGLGWSLLAGGVVTRAVMDIPDDYNRDEIYCGVCDRCPEFCDRWFGDADSDEHPRIGRFWNNESSQIKNFDPNSTTYNYLLSELQDIDANYGVGDFHTQYYTSSYWKYGDPWAGMNDSEPDIFYFNFAGKSGKFVFDVDGNSRSVKMIPFQDIEITSALDSNGEIISFTIIDEDGTTYLFSTVERITSRNLNESASWGQNGPGHYSGATAPSIGGTIETSFNSSWFLTSVTTKYGEILSFQYENEPYLEQSGHSLTYMFDQSASSVPNFWSMGWNVLESTTKKRISSISSENETIEFNAMHEREDLREASNAITSVDIYSNLADSKNLIRTYTLEYSYFQSPTSEPVVVSGAYSPEIYSHIYKRLKLNSIEETGQPPYEFSYNDTYVLPHRFSLQKDIWGFFNGESNNLVPIPTVYVYPTLEGNDRFKVYESIINFPPPGPGNPNFVIPGANRLPNSKVTAGILNKIKYPTGGYTVFDFEGHMFYDDNQSLSGGGVRINKISKFDGESSNPVIERTYNYLDGTTSSGRILQSPLFVSIWGNTLDEIYIHSNSLTMLGSTSGSLVGYEKVTETYGDESGNVGNKVYEFNIPAVYGEQDDSSGDDLYEATNSRALYYPYDGNLNLNWSILQSTEKNFSPYAPNPNYDWNRGQLMSEKTYTTQGDLVNEVTFGYDLFYPNNRTLPYKVFGLVISPMDPRGSGSGYHNIAFFSKYEVLAEVAKVLTTKTIKEYEVGTSHSITKTTEYKYGSNHMNPIEISEQNSNSDKSITKYKYPLDYYNSSGGPIGPDEGVYALINKRITNIPIEITQYIEIEGEEYLTNAALTSYNLESGIPVVRSSFKLDTKKTLTDFVPSGIAGGPGFFTMDSRYDEKITVIEYDEKGNVLEVEDKITGITTSYIWGYNEQYPIAKVINATYLEIESVIPALTLSDLNNGYKTVVSNPGPPLVTINLALTDSEVRNLLEPIRSNLPNAQISTFTYKPLVGMTSQTDPNGQITYYEYDEWGRLLRIRNNDGFIISQYEYHYESK